MGSRRRPGNLRGDQVGQLGLEDRTVMDIPRAPILPGEPGGRTPELFRNRASIFSAERPLQRPCRRAGSDPGGFSAELARGSGTDKKAWSTNATHAGYQPL